LRYQHYFDLKRRQDWLLGGPGGRFPEGPRQLCTADGEASWQDDGGLGAVRCHPRRAHGEFRPARTIVTYNACHRAKGKFP
jgi:hypothetical protein